MGAGVLLAGLLVDAWILRRAIRPVEQIINAAERIALGNLSTRIETKSGTAELGRLTKVLNDTFRSLDLVFAQQSRFTADVAHELRTPVSILIAEAQGALERERKAEEYRDTISTTLRSARRMAGLIESLLELAQLETSEAHQRSPCDLATMSSDALESLKPTAAAHQISIQATLEPTPVTGHASQLTQVIYNLLLNAIQHNEAGGRVEIQTGHDYGAPFLRVGNTGPGIGSEDLPHIFDRFYRTDASRSRKTGGAGLGLAICKAIADAHGASLTVTSEPGGLTFVSLQFPSSASI